jgi:WD40 repeat protein
MSIYDGDGVVTTGPVEIGQPVFPIESAQGLVDQRYARRDQWNVDDSVVAFLVHDESTPAGSDLSVLVLRAGDDHVTPIDLGGFDPTVMDWSRTTDMLAVGGLDGSLRFITEHGSVVSDPILGGNAPITYVQWSTKDRLLTRDSAGVMRIYTAGGAKIAEVDGQRNCSDPVWSPPGDALVAACNTSSIVFYDGAASVIGRFRSDAESNPPVWSPDGSMIALADTQGRVQLVATDGALIIAETVFQASGETGVPRVVWAPSGEVLAGAHAAGGSLMYGWSEHDACQFLRRFFDSTAMNAMLGSGEVSTCGSDVELTSLPLVPVMQRRPDRP